MRTRIAVLSALVIVGLFLLLSSVNVGLTIGSEWFGANASSPWHMNNYLVIPAQYAYIYFGLAALAIGGLATGIAAPAFFASNKSIKTKITSVAAFFGAIVLTGLGFNTLDFMSGNFYWTNMQYPAPVKVPIVGAVDVWNYYFFFFVVPLWLGGFIVGAVASYYTFVYRPKHLAAAYATKKNYTGLLGQNVQKSVDTKEYMVETGAFSRNRPSKYKPKSMATTLPYNAASSKNMFSNRSRIAVSTSDTN